MNLIYLRLLVLTICISLSSVYMAEEEANPSTAKLWEIVQQQQKEISELKEALGELTDNSRTTEARTQELAAQISATADFVDTIQATSIDDQRKTRIGGYGELHMNYLSAKDSERDTEKVDFHRYVLFIEYSYSNKVTFFSEIELEHSLAGDGKPGEVELEQAFVEFSPNDSMFLRTGLFLVPIGILNESHEPPTFYGVERNSVENVIIPSTWWEGGAAIGGRSANGLAWEAAIHSGLSIPVSGSNAFRVRSGRQKVAEARASNLAYSIRGSFTGVSGLLLAASWHHQNDPSQNDDDGLDTGTLISLAATLKRGNFEARAMWAGWTFNGEAVEAAGADKQTGWYFEPAFHFDLGTRRAVVHYRWENVEGARIQDRYSQSEVGVNFYPIEDVVLKLDYRNRDHDIDSANSSNFDGIDLGFGYQF